MTLGTCFYQVGHFVYGTAVVNPGVTHSRLHLNLIYFRLIRFCGKIEIKIYLKYRYKKTRQVLVITHANSFVQSWPSAIDGTCSQAVQSDCSSDIDEPCSQTVLSDCGGDWWHRIRLSAVRVFIQIQYMK